MNCGGASAKRAATSASDRAAFASAVEVPPRTASAATKRDSGVIPGRVSGLGAIVDVVSITDFIQLLVELIPRRVRQGLLVLLGIGLVVGFARPAFNAAVSWYLETSAREISQQVTPMVQELFTAAAPAPTSKVRP